MTAYLSVFHAQQGPAAQVGHHRHEHFVSPRAIKTASLSNTVVRLSRAVNRQIPEAVTPGKASTSLLASPIHLAKCLKRIQSFKRLLVRSDTFNGIHPKRWDGC
ncbi:hypothetical protein BDV06DRAFT_190139, partial [Aspergillus oleicola]